MKALRCCHPLTTGTAEVLADAARYIAIVLVMIFLLRQMAQLLSSWM
jgi:hypothetical protein